MIILAFFLAHWYLSVLMQTLFLHRYAAHQMFTMSSRWGKVFYVLTFIGQGSSFLSPRAYGIMHRLHHRNAGPAPPTPGRTRTRRHSPKTSST